MVNITKFGAFVNILPGRDGLLHVSKMGGGRRVERVEDVLALGDKISVVVREIDDRGKVSLDLGEGVELVKGGGAGGGETSGQRSERGDDRGRRDDGRGRRDRKDRKDGDRGGRDRQPRGGGRSEAKPEAKPGRTVVSFEEEFDPDS